jgi:hypothetical protein
MVPIIVNDLILDQHQIEHMRQILVGLDMYQHLD